MVCAVIQDSERATRVCKPNAAGESPPIPESVLNPWGVQGLEAVPLRENWRVRGIS